MLIVPAYFLKSLEQALVAENPLIQGDDADTHAANDDEYDMSDNDGSSSSGTSRTSELREDFDDDSKVMKEMSTSETTLNTNSAKNASGHDALLTEEEKELNDLIEMS